MPLVLACHPGALNSFALKLKEGETLASVRSRIAKKLHIQEAADAENGFIIKYEWIDVLYSLEDGALALPSAGDCSTWG